MMSDTTKKQVTTRLRRIQGQLAGIQHMLDDNRYCVDILLQIAAAQAALGQAGKLVLRSHVDTCVTAALRGGKVRDRKQKLDELMEVFTRYGRLGER